MATELAPECARAAKARSDWRRCGGNKAEIMGAEGLGLQGCCQWSQGYPSSLR